MVDDFGDGSGAEPAADSDSGGRQEGTDYSGTNNQENGVDEADLVKTDGYHLYTVNGNRLHIFGVPEFGTLVPESVTSLEGHPVELLLDGERNRAAVFSFVYVDRLPEEHPLRALVGGQQVGNTWWWRTWALSKITIFDVSDSAAPALEREVWLEGWYQTARKNDHSVRAAINGQIRIPGLDNLWSLIAGRDPTDPDVRADIIDEVNAADLEDLIPRLYERTPSGEISARTIAGDGCRSFYYPTDSAGRGTTSIVSIDLASGDLAYDADTVVSNWSTVYASTDRLYVAEHAWDWWWSWSRNVEPGDVFTPATNIHAFDISTAGQSAYIGSGRIDGTVINQFALDEEDGRLRVAATTTSWVAWNPEGPIVEPPPPESHVYILQQRDGELLQVGHLGGIAPNESLFAARFLADRAYLVTFEQIDPLFTVDLSNPRRPRLVGELEVPGFSTYLHPIADGRLLAIGVGGDDNGANWRTQVSMFDVSDMARPSLVDAEELVTEGWAWSEAQYQHKAFTYFAPKELLAVPLSSYTETNGPDGYTFEWSSQLRLIHVDTRAGLSSRGALDHSRFYNNGDDWWGMPEVRRSIFMGDYLYALSARALTVHALDDLSEVAAEELPGPTGTDYWWW